MKTIRVKPELLTLLTSDRFKHFTADELCKAYLEIPECNMLTKQAVTQFIKRNLTRLESRGFITRINKNQDRHTRFQLSDSFIFDNYKASKPHCKPIPNDFKTPDVFFTELQSKLHVYKQELLTTKGEVQEYDEICSRVLKNRKQIQELFNKAHDRYSITLGKIRAIENILSQNTM